MFDLNIWVGMKAAGKPIVALTAYDFQMTMVLNSADIDMILVGDSLGMVVLGHPDTTRVRVKDICHHVKAVSNAHPRIPIVADMAFLSFGVTIRDTIRNAKKLIAAGAQAVKLEGGSRIACDIAALLENGIPVIGHLGLTPQSILRLGRYQVMGKTSKEARRLVQDAKLLDGLGVSAIVLESIPEKLGAEITRSVKTPTIGIGAGRETDGQILVINDLLGMSDPALPRPRFVHRFAEIYDAMLAGVNSYSQAVRTREFPASSQVYFPDKKEKK